MTPLPVLLKIKHVATKGTLNIIELWSKSATRTCHRTLSRTSQDLPSTFWVTLFSRRFLKRFALGSPPLTGNLSDPSHTAPSELCKCRENWGRGPYCPFLPMLGSWQTLFWQLIGLGINWSTFKLFGGLLAASVPCMRWLDLTRGFLSQKFDSLYNYWTCLSAPGSTNHGQTILIHDPWPEA